MNTRAIFTQTFITMAVIILVIISTAIETDIFVPSFPTIQSYFGTTEAIVQMIISINFLGLCVGSLFYGPLSDSYGRRPVLLAGMLLFTVSSVACVFSASIGALIFWRFIQGLGSAVAFVVPAAIIYDIHNQEKAAKMLGIYNSIITLAMSFAPIIGSYLYLTFHWRANFVFVAGLAAVAFLFSLTFVHESLDKQHRQALHLGKILSGFKQLLKHPRAMGNLYIICAVMGAYFAYISNLSLIFINHLGLANDVYAYYQAVILLTFATLSFFSGRIIARFGVSRTRLLGKLIMVMGASLLMLVAIFAQSSALFITIAMTIFTAGFAVSLGIIFGDYMNIFPMIKGIASSLSNCIRMLAMSVMVAFSGAIFTGTIMPVACIVLVAGISSLLVMLWMQRR